MNELVTIFAQHGLPGLIILGLWWELRKRTEEFNQKEALWHQRETFWQERLDAYVKQSLEVIDRNTAMAAELKTSLQAIKESAHVHSPTP